jgi:hypothetical protein
MVVEWSGMWRRAYRRLLWSKTRPRARRKRIEPRQGPILISSKTGQSDLVNRNIQFL